MKSTPAEELRAIARAARGLLEELAEEGVDQFDAIAAAPLAEREGLSETAPAAASAEARPTAREPAQLDIVQAPSTWVVKPDSPPHHGGDQVWSWELALNPPAASVTVSQTVCPSSKGPSTQLSREWTLRTRSSV